MAKTLFHFGSNPSQPLNDLEKITSPLDVVFSSVHKLWEFNEKLNMEYLEWAMCNKCSINMSLYFYYKVK